MNVKIIGVVLVSGALGFGICTAISASSEPKIDTVSHDMRTMSEEVSMEEQVKQLSGELDDKTRNALDRAFVENMIVHHQGAIEMAEKVVDQTKRPEVKALAEEIIATQGAEVETMNGWLKKWYGL
ncbi:MAG: hypothetical protein A3D17_13105 [Bdellovibrionales bacterium RIFCSPHIGHO2_02_FULL_40_15]|nr:MAG: hypothetical protein A3D17_13105 [Bdellovibrionales bacterium RIFCSPHIGHO2_02_FULL_40_15]